MGLTMPSYPGAQLRPLTSLQQSSITGSESFLPSTASTDPSHSAQSHETQHSPEREDEAEWKALKRRPLTNCHLLCHLASFNPGHAEPISVGLDSLLGQGTMQWEEESV